MATSCGEKRRERAAHTTESAPGALALAPMIVAISRFRVKNALEAEVASAFVARPRRVEQAPGFLGLEVFRAVDDDATFLLVTRWSDRASFERWHQSPEHHAAHAAMPRGLKLEPEHTELVLAERVEGASTEARASDLAPLFGRMMRQGEGLFVATLDAEGRVLEANPAMRALVVGDELRLTEASRAALEAALRAPPEEATLLQVLGPDGAPLSLRCWVAREGDGHVLVGEPPWGEHQRLARLLFELNNELSVLQREASRRHAELEHSHWHLRKISEVLPICLGCRKVKDGVTWEEASHFLHTHSRFLSHGYCERCRAEALAREASEAGEQSEASDAEPWSDGAPGARGEGS